MSEDAHAPAHAAVVARTTAHVLALDVWLAAVCIALTALEQRARAAARLLVRLAALVGAQLALTLALLPLVP